MKYSTSRDANERAIVEALQRVPGQKVTCQPIEGAQVYKGSHMPSAGTPDMMVGYLGITYLLEVKNPAAHNTSGSARIPVKEFTSGAFKSLWQRVGPAVMKRLRRSQALWMVNWAGSPVHVVTTAQEAAAVLGLCLTCGDAPVPTTGLCADCQAELAGVS